jgi:hypothetical protein
MAVTCGVSNHLHHQPIIKGHHSNKSYPLCIYKNTEVGEIRVQSLVLVGNNDAATWKGLAVSRTWLEFCLHCQKNQYLDEVVRFSPYLQLKSTCKELRPKREQQ